MTSRHLNDPYTELPALAERMGTALPNPANPASTLPDLPEIPDWFDAASYLQANQDVQRSLNLGQIPSAFHHYQLYGRAEGRPLYKATEAPLNRLVLTPLQHPGGVNPGAVRGQMEAVLLSKGGGMLVVGWVDDVASPLARVRVACPNWFYTLTASRVARYRRRDVETALGDAGNHSFGFFGFEYLEQAIELPQKCQVTLSLEDGREFSYELPVRIMAEADLRNTTLNYIAESDLFGNRQVEALKLAQGPLGEAVVRHNCAISREIIKGAYVERFGPQGRAVKGSIVVCLYGKPEYLFLQNALFANESGIEDYEFIYVCNSPELAERLMKDARASQPIYDLAQTLVLLPGNSGFGAANNVAARHARSNRLLIVNPDVFPKDRHWAKKHTHLVQSLPEIQTQIFGAALYYDDGSLMHGGMYFEYDTGISIDHGEMSGRRMVRVEHYGKGAPADSTAFNRSRPVPAVTGAFISIDREWFNQLGGFTEDYVFGHYEDADLCLKSITAGVMPWMHDLRLWHLEGKGSTRLPVHEGGSYVNRALFSQRWDDTISRGLVGPNPTHPLFSRLAALADTDPVPLGSVTPLTPRQAANNPSC